MTQRWLVSRKQVHWSDKFIPKLYSKLTDDERSKVLESHMFIIKKHTCETKASSVGGRNKQQGNLTKEDSSLPTVATKSVLLTSIVNAAKKRDVAIIDISNVFIQT